MKNWERTNLIRQKHRFLYHGEEFFCFDLTLEDYLMITMDEVAGYTKILMECNETLPKLNLRQGREFMRIILWWEEEKKTIMDQLTETQKRINDFKKKNGEKTAEKLAKDLEDILEDWHIIEGQMMHFLGQPLSEMRKWPYRYFMDMYKDLAICTGAKEYEKGRRSKGPDKKAFKKEFGGMYQG